VVSAHEVQTVLRQQKTLLAYLKKRNIKKRSLNYKRAGFQSVAGGLSVLDFRDKRKQT